MTATVDTAVDAATLPVPPSAPTGHPTTPDPTAAPAGHPADTAPRPPLAPPPAPRTPRRPRPGRVTDRSRRRAGRRPARTAPPARPSRPGDTRRPPTPTGLHRSPNRPAPTPAPPPASRPVQLHDWFAARLLKVLSGQRPVHSMLGHTRGEAYDQLVRLAPHAPLRPAERHAAPPTVHRVGVFQPRPGAVEVFARVVCGARLRAMAFRLEFARSRRWVCSAVEIDT